MLECFRFGLYWRGIMHDMSKFSPDEFIPYAQWFYGFFGIGWSQEKYGGCGDEIATHERLRKAFDVAWLKHLHRNQHHHQHWLLVNDSDGTYPLKMPRKYALEMWCDWIGAGLAITGRRDVKLWYSKNKTNMNLYPSTREYIERLM
jgi:hypothetical protein